LAIIILHAITGVCTPACLLAASISVEAVTPPLVGLAFKELLLLWGGSYGKSNDGGGGWRLPASHVSRFQSLKVSELRGFEVQTLLVFLRTLQP